jgi:uncharacterized protein (DUF2237 family)
MKELNVLGQSLQSCSQKPMTGFFRDGSCRTCHEDTGIHTVCAVMTDEFLSFSKSRGNDLSTPMPQYNFPGLRAGDQWCLCAGRWVEAFKAGAAPKVNLAATHEETLAIVGLDILKRFAI